jgi:DNA-binding IclR family transcriptional regulator
MATAGVDTYGGDSLDGLWPGGWARTAAGALGMNESPDPRLEKPTDRRYAAPVPQNHRTVDRVTRILEEVVYSPGITFAELARALDAPKSSVHGFLRGLLAKGWLYEVDRGFYLGPAVYGLTLASGHIRAGLVSHADLVDLREEVGLAVFLGVEAGDYLIYVAEAGGDTDPVAGFDARSNIRRSLLGTAGGKALLAAWPEAEREAYLRRRNHEEAELVEAFLQEFEEINRTGIATNLRRSGTRFALASTIRNHSQNPIASVTIVGAAADVSSRVDELSEVLLERIGSWSQRSMSPREAI